MTPAAEASQERILVLASLGRDADLTVDLLLRAEIEAAPVATADLASRLAEPTAAVIVTWEALDPAALGDIARFVSGQPPWSDMPFLVFGPVDPGETAEALAQGELSALGNVTLLDRPIRVLTLLSAVETALRARRRQYAMRDLVARVEEGIRQRDQFLAMLGHELRNPLGAVLTAAEVIELAVRDDLASAAPIVARQAAAIRRQGGVLTRLVDDLLDVARVTSGKVPLKKVAVDLADVARRTVEASAQRAKDKELEVRVHQREPVWVTGDPTRLEQVASNLLTNAIKYTPAGGQVDLTLGTDGDSALLSLRDTGVGIEPELLPAVFDLFKQADHTLARADGGLGIGLTLVRSLVELHGGSVVARSEGLGRGSEFTVRLPLAEAPPERPQALSPNAAQGKVQPRVFVVEDHEDNREALVVLLRQIGCRVAFAADGEEGARGIVDARPEVAIVDIGLPGMDGYAVAQYVRAALNDDILLVALTGYGQPRDREMALSAGFDVHLRKPVDLNQLRALIAGASTRAAAR